MKNNRKILLILMIAVLASACMLVTAGCGGSKGDGQKDADEALQEDAAEEQGQAEEEGADKAEPEAEPEEEEVYGVNTDNITINTQSSIRIAGSKTVYIDPYKRSEAAHDADIVFITHAHYDHFDPPSLKNVVNDDTLVICPVSMRSEVEGLNLTKTGVTTLQPGDAVELGGDNAGITVEAVPAYNLNKNFHPKANGWVGYVIKMDGVSYYAAGDTDALPELESVQCDIAFVPVGGTYTMTAPEAAGLVNKIKPEIAVPIHYGTIVGKAADADTFKAALDSDIEVVTKVEDAK